MTGRALGMTLIILSLLGGLVDQEFWKKKWQTRKIGFHQNEVNTRLAKYWDKFSSDMGTVFVPLCGKSIDMVYLANLGHQILSVELSELAIREFAAEQGLSFAIEEVENFKIFRAESYTFYCGDFFQLPVALMQDVKYIYDRAALIALPEAMRHAYGRWICRHVSHAKIMLLSIEFDNLKIGPPFSLNQEEIEQIYGQSFQIEKILEKSLETTQVPHTEHISHLIERVHFLKPL